MQRQSLSPNSKNSGNLTAVPPDSDDDKLLIRSSTSSRSAPSSSITVHLIPVLTLLCLLVLFLISHEPSPLDLPTTRGIDRIRILDRNAAGIVSAAIRNKRGLMEETATQTRIRSRKLGIR